MNFPRITSLVDGVFAIVMTLLVFDFDVPHIAEKKVFTQLLPSLLKLWPKLLTYILSFIILGIFWVTHHQQFKFIIRVDRNILWINILFLMAVAFVPFSASLISEYGKSQEAVIIYGINLIIIGSILSFHWSYATHRNRLIKKDLEKDFINKVNRTIMIANIFYLAAIVISFLSTKASIFIYLLVPLYYLRPSRFDNYSVDNKNV